MSDVDRAIIRNAVLAARSVEGECKYCHCHGDSCSLPEGGDARCTWFNNSRTVCTGPGCIRAHGKEERKRKLFSSRRPKGRAA